MDKITELLTRGVDKIYPSKEELEKVLRSGKKLTLYMGFDPTGTQLHIGHMVGLMKLKQWQDLGHHVIFLIGDGTGQAGDPSGKTKSRETFFTREQLRKNATDYVKQAGNIVRFDGENPIKILYNGDWLNSLKLVDILDIAGHFTLQQMIERDLFQERIKNNEPVNLREFIYPLLQGYDSVAMSVDLEIGGTDQTFNMLCGRTLIREMQGREKFVLTTPLLTDAEGRKIGKTEGNVIALTDTPSDLFGKIMSLPDSVIIKGFLYLTEIPQQKIQIIEKAIKEGMHPMQYKKKLAFEIIQLLHGEQTAIHAQDAFERTVQKKEAPVDVPKFFVKKNNDLFIIAELLVATGLASSKSEAKRLIEQGGVEIDNERITEPNKEITIGDSVVIKVGKRKFIEVTVEE